MCVIRWFLLKSCIFGMYISVTGASVLLQTLNGGTTYSKGSNVTLVCTITPYNNEMTWYVDNDPYGGCFLGTCAPSANKPYTFSFDFDETTGVFKLTIDPVDSSHAELSFVCDDGTVTKTISFTVTADNGTTSNTSKTPTKPDINNQITVTNEGNGDNDNSELSIGAIVGIVFGCVVGLSFLCVVVFAVFLRCTRKKRGTEQHDAEQNDGVDVRPEQEEGEEKKDSVDVRPEQGEGEEQKDSEDDVRPEQGEGEKQKDRKEFLEKGRQISVMLGSTELSEKIYKKIKDVLSSMQPKAKEALYKAMEKEEQEREKKLKERLDRITKEHNLIKSQDQIIEKLILIEEQEQEGRPPQFEKRTDRIHQGHMIGKPEQEGRPPQFQKRTDRIHQGHMIGKPDRIHQGHMIGKPEQGHKLELIESLDRTIKELISIRDQDGISEELNWLKKNENQRKLTLIRKTDGISEELNWLKQHEKPRKQSLSKEIDGIKNELNVMTKQGERRHLILIKKTELAVDETFRRYIKQELVENRTFWDSIGQDVTFSSFIMQVTEKDDDTNNEWWRLIN